MAFWKKIFKSKYTGAEIDAAVAKAGDATKVVANPTLAGTEAALTGLEVGETKYKVEQPINVVANPTLAGTEAALEGLQVGETKYKVGGENLLIVTITGNPREGIFQSDKTFNEISTALTDGIPVIVNLDVITARTCVISKPGAINIYSLEITGSTMYIDVFKITSNDAITRETYTVSVTSL